MRDSARTLESLDPAVTARPMAPPVATRIPATLPQDSIDVRVKGSIPTSIASVRPITGYSGLSMEKKAGVSSAMAIADRPCAPHTPRTPKKIKAPASAAAGMKRPPRPVSTQYAAESNTTDAITSRRNANTTGANVAGALSATETMTE